MKALLIPPTPELARFAVGDMHLALAHLIDQVDQGRYYEEHYRRESQHGAYVILDNSAFELGESGFSMPELLDMAAKIRAQELVFPDAMQDAEKTARLTSQAIEAFAREGAPERIRPMYVAQGEDIVAYSECLRFIVRMHLLILGPRPFTIGISRVYDEVFPHGRYGILQEYIEQLRAELVAQNLGDILETHLLGWSTLPDLAVIARSFPWVRSIDSSKPFAWAMANKYLHQLAEGEEEPQRPVDYFDTQLSGVQFQIAQYNVDRFAGAAQGHQLPQGVL
jgi:hypothetical protein